MVCFNSVTLRLRRRLPFLTSCIFFDCITHFWHFSLPLAGVDIEKDTFGLVDATSPVHKGVVISASGTDMVLVKLIDSASVGENAKPVLTGEAILLVTG